MKWNREKENWTSPLSVLVRLYKIIVFLLLARVRVVWVILFLLSVSVGLLFLPRLLSYWNRDVVPIDGVLEPLQVDLTVLGNELIATKDNLPWKVAYTLASISNAAYEEWPSDQAECDKRDFNCWGFKNVLSIENNNQCAYVLSNDDIVVVAFRGSDDWEDYKKDAWCFQKPCHGGRIHDGFLSALNDVKKDIVSTMRTHGAAKKRIWITGHSLGGAMAVIFGYECIVKHNLSPTGVVTFGQPRCFDRPLGDSVGKELKGIYVRFMNGKDIVPWLPPPIPLPFRAPYIHSGARYLFFDGMYDFIDYSTLCAAPPGEEKASFFDGEKRISSEQYADLERRILQAKQSMPKLTMAKGTGTGTSIRWLAEQIPEFRDHLMENYLSSIERNAKTGSGTGNGVGSL